MKRVLVFILTCSVFLLTGCQGNGGAEKKIPPAPAEESSIPAAKGQAVSSMDHAALLEKLAPDISETAILFSSLDTNAVRAGFLDVSWILLGERFGKPQRQALVTELSEFAKKHIGVDLLGVDWIAIAVDKGSPSLFIGGKVSGLNSFTKTTLEGLEFSEGPTGALFFPIDPGKVTFVTIEQDTARAFALRRKEKKSLATDAKRLGKLKDALTSSGKGGVIAAAIDMDAPFIKKRILGEIAQELKKDAITEFDWLGISLGDTLQVHIHGSPGSIKALSEVYDFARSQALSAVATRRAELDDYEFADGSLIILLSHLTAPVFDAFKPTIEGETAKISLHIGYDNATFIGATLISLAAQSAAVFSAYINDSKVAEAEENLYAIGHGAMAFYDEEHMQSPVDLADPKGGSVVANVFPTEENTKNWQKCTSTGNVLGAKSAPNSADFDSGPWRAVRFNMSRPHYFKYCWEKAEDKSFKVVATASLKTADDTVLMIEGSVNGRYPDVGRPVVVKGRHLKKKRAKLKSFRPKMLWSDKVAPEIDDICDKVERREKKDCYRALAEMEDSLGEDLWIELASCLDESEKIDGKAFQKCFTEEMEKKATSAKRSRRNGYYEESYRDDYYDRYSR